MLRVVKQEIPALKFKYWHLHAALTRQGFSLGSSARWRGWAAAGWPERLAVDQMRLADDDCTVGVSLVARLLSEEQLLAASNGPPDSIVHLVVDKRAKPDRCAPPQPWR